MPPEIRARGPRAELAFQRAMRNGRVQVYRGRIMLLGQDRAGKTSLKKSLLGIPFNPEEENTVGVEVDPSKFEVDVDKVQNWQRTEQKKLDVSEFADDIARIIAKDLTETEIDQRNNDDVKVALEQVIIRVIFQIQFFYFHRWKHEGVRGKGILPHCDGIEVTTTWDDAMTWELRHDFGTVIFLDFSIFFQTMQLQKHS